MAYTGGHGGHGHRKRPILRLIGRDAAQRPRRPAPASTASSTRHRPLSSARPQLNQATTERTGRRLALTPAWQALAQHGHDITDCEVDGGVRVHAVEQLGLAAAAATEPALAELLSDDDDEVRDAALAALSKVLGGDRTRVNLHALAARHDSISRPAAAYLATAGHPATLIARLGTWRSPDVRRTLREGLVAAPRCRASSSRRAPRPRTRCRAPRPRGLPAPQGTPRAFGGRARSRSRGSSRDPLARGRERRSPEACSRQRKRGAPPTGSGISCETCTSPLTLSSCR